MKFDIMYALCKMLKHKRYENQNMFLLHITFEV